VDVPVTLLGSGAHYCLEVQGDSMVEAGIQNGDIAIIKSADTAESGEIVVALIDDTEATLKRLRKRGAQSRSSPPMPLRNAGNLRTDRVKIQGAWPGSIAATTDVRPRRLDWRRLSRRAVGDPRPIAAASIGALASHTSLVEPQRLNTVAARRRGGR